MVPPLPPDSSSRGPSNQEESHQEEGPHGQGGSSDRGHPPPADTASPSDGKPSTSPASRSSRTITKKELVARIADRTGQTKVVAKDVIQLFLDEIVRELSMGNRLEFREFGVFEVKERAPRLAQNPVTLEKVQVPAKKVVKFKVGRLMRLRVAEGAPAAKEVSVDRDSNGSDAPNASSDSPSNAMPGNSKE